MRMKRTDKRFERDEEGRAIVHMNVKDDGDFLSVFSASETPVISSEVAEFLENVTANALPNEKFALRITSDRIDDEEKIVYEKAIREYYREKRIADGRELRKNNLIAAVLAALGVLVLAFAVALEYRLGSLIWAEVIDIAAWVFLWEAVDICFFKTRELKADERRALAFTEMKIEFFTKE